MKELLKMDVSNGLNPRLNSNSLNRAKNEEKQSLNGQTFKSETVEYSHIRSNQSHFQSTSALEILRETVRILRYNLTGFMAIAAVLICPVSAVFLSNVLVNQSQVKKLATRLLLVAKFNGFPLNPLMNQLCQKFSEMAISTAMCFPMFATISLLSKAAVIYSVDSTYSRKKIDSSKLHVITVKIWKHLVFTYLWACSVISGCLTLFLVLLVAVSSVFSIMGLPFDLILYPAMGVVLIFSIILANAIVVCNTAMVISVLEDVSGPQALLKSSLLIKRRTQVGFLIFLGSRMGMAFVQCLFDSRVKTLSYGDGSSRIWEGPLLVVMYSFVVLLDSMMSAVYYFSCKSYHMESANVKNEPPVLEVLTIPSASADESLIE